MEEGTAALHENGVDWVYITQKANANVSGTKLRINASDRRPGDLPGNKVEREEVIA